MKSDGDDGCYLLYMKDIQKCKDRASDIEYVLGEGKSKEFFEVCHSAASERLANCTAKRPITPPLPKGIFDD